MIHIQIKHPIRFFAIGLLILGLFACAPRAVQKQAVEKPPAPKRILSLTTHEDADWFHVLLKSNELLTYTSVKQPSPLGVILYFPETVIDTPKAAYVTDSDTVGAIQMSKLKADTPTSRIEISLKQDVPYKVERDGKDLKISFKKPIQTASEQTTRKLAAETTTAEPVAEKAPAASVFKSISTETTENSLEVSVKADGAVRDYHSFSVDSPARIVFDLFNLKSPEKKEQQVPVDSDWVKRIRYYGYPDRLRIVLNTSKDYLTSYSATPVKDGLIIRVTASGRKAVTAPGIDHEDRQSSVTAADKPATTEKIASAGSPTAPAWVNRIDFSSEPRGKSAVIIGTTRPVKFDLKKISEKKMQLQLFDTRLPDYRQRPLITTRFESAVDRITPFHTAALKDTALVSIELRESVPYLVEQTDSVLRIQFEASSVLPRPADAAALPTWEKALAQKPDAAAAPVAPEQQSVQDTGATPSGQKPPEQSRRTIPQDLETSETQETPLPGSSKKKFTGEKIALDFYETDIKNVFRILREVSGKNFAVDPGVEGKVTISLSNPVPWDAVLDLILGMNQLAKVEEAGIIRIAKRETLSSESAAEQAATANEMQAKEQIKALEPLLTEYIPINYANAEADVLPHIVVTPDRGSVTVDGRNNQIIITDTKEMLEKAKNTIREIDQVTPQVLIEARVVEAASTFSRELGATLSVQITDILTKELGNGIIPEGKTDLNMSAANPVLQPLGQIGIDFTKLVGTPLNISATLLAAESAGQVKIISSPKVLTLDNKTAKIRQGTQVPVPFLDDSGNTVIEYKDVDLELEVTPHVTPDRRISMAIKITNNEIGQPINDSISFTTKEATTELLVNDGETIVIGGIRKTKKDESESGVPGLMKVPLLGWFFKTQTRSEDLQELLIFITPRIVQLEQRDKLKRFSTSVQ